jgi:hypothetical protein
VISSIIMAGCHIPYIVNMMRLPRIWCQYQWEVAKLVIIHSCNINDQKRKDWLTQVSLRGLQGGQETSSESLKALSVVLSSFEFK